MSQLTEFLRTQTLGGPGIPGNTPNVFMDLQTEHAALESGFAIVDRSDRVLLEATGKDRHSWLHNLTTNQVKNLGAREGVYAFALNLQGRILFDLNVLNVGDALWLDFDRRWLDVARKHLNKYIIIEDVKLTDRSNELARIGLVGPQAPKYLASQGMAQAGAMAQLATTSLTLNGNTLTAVRHDFCGPIGFELIVEQRHAMEIWKSLVESGHSLRPVPAGQEAVQIRRIEAGIPWPGSEITDEYLPAETRQLDRAVSYTKGCYLGQEVVERMRSRHVVARQLVGMLVDGEAAPPAGSPLLGPDDKPLGTVTSSCRSIALQRLIALGYVKSALSAPGTALRIPVDAASVPVQVSPLPFVGAAPH